MDSFGLQLDLSISVLTWRSKRDAETFLQFTARNARAIVFLLRRLVVHLPHAPAARRSAANQARRCENKWHVDTQSLPRRSDQFLSRSMTFSLRWVDLDQFSCDISFSFESHRMSNEEHERKRKVFLLRLRLVIDIISFWRFDFLNHFHLINYLSIEKDLHLIEERFFVLVVVVVVVSSFFQFIISNVHVETILSEIFSLSNLMDNSCFRHQSSRWDDQPFFSSLVVVLDRLNCMHTLQCQTDSGAISLMEVTRLAC